MRHKDAGGQRAATAPLFSELCKATRLGANAKNWNAHEQK